MVIKQYEDIIRTKKTGLNALRTNKERFLSIQGQRKIIKLVSEFKLHKSTIVFKINISKLLNKYTKLMKSSVTLGFLKNLIKDIK